MSGKEVATGPTIDDALSYVRTVKEALIRGERATYKDFLKLVADYRARIIDPKILHARVGKLFKDHPNLLAGFNAFLPRSEQPTKLPAIIEGDEEEAEENLLNKIKERFQTCDTHVPNSYVKIMNDFKEGKKSEKEVRDEVIDLIYYHEDLVDEFLRLQ